MIEPMERLAAAVSDRYRRIMAVADTSAAQAQLILVENLLYQLNAIVRR